MSTIWRAKCKHRDVRVNGDFGLRHGDGSPRWEPCLVCDVQWRRYEVTETVVYRLQYPSGQPIFESEDRTAVCSYPANGVIRTIRKRTLRRSS